MPDPDAVPETAEKPSGAAAPALDPATASLSRALNTAFALLKALMAGAALLFLLSCMRTVDKTDVGIVRRFGRILTDADGQVRLFKSDRPYFIWPEPLEQLEVVRVGIDNLYLDNDFWTAPPPAGIVMPPNSPPADRGALSPAADGYCLTGDMNIVHTRWRIEFSVDEEHPEDYFDGGAAGLAGQTHEQRHQDRLRILSLAARGSVFRVFAGLPADVLLGEDRWEPERIAEMVRSELEKAMEDDRPGREGRWRGGLRVRGLYLTALHPPQRVYGIFEQVRNAGQEASRMVAVWSADARKRVSEADAKAKETVAFARTHQGRVLANAQAEVDRVRSFMDEFRGDPRGLEVAVQQYRLDRLKDVLGRARLMRVPKAPAGAANMLRIRSADMARNKDDRP